MRVLLVEDEDRSVRQALEVLGRVEPGIEVTVASTRDDALQRIGESDFDLIVCDLKIPPSASSADANEAHGFAVHEEARKACPGTPTVFLTGFATTANIKRKLSGGGVGDLFGLTEFAMVSLVEKDDLGELETLVRSLSVARAATIGGCTVDFVDCEPNEILTTAAQIYGRSIDQIRATAHSSSGLSGASAARVLYESESTAPASVFMKVTSVAKARQEFDCFSQNVPNRLQPGTFAPVVKVINEGLGRHAALVSTLADAQHVPFFSLIRDGNEAEAVRSILELRANLAPWDHEVARVETTVRELRLLRTADDVLDATGVSGDIDRAESRAVSLARGVVHGDLHGENVLVSNAGRPVLIDFGDSGLGWSVADPLTLEMSLYLHQNGPGRDSDWYQEADWSAWADVDRFTEGCPFADVIRACREWALARDGEAALLAFGYAHVLRHMKYPDRDVAVIRAVAGSAASRLIEPA